MNPFVKNFKLQLIQVSESTKMVDASNISDGIIMNYETVTKTFIAEKQQKTYVYDVPYIENILYSELKSNGRDLYLYLIHNMKPDCDFINLKTEFVCKKMKISRPTLTRAISQLIDIGVLCKKTQSEYWINPFYIFKGNRIKFYNKTYPDCIEVSCKLNK